MAENKQTVYIVTSGEYSDYHIDAVFLDRSLAEAYCDKYPDTEIGEYTADEKAPETDKLWYDVSVHADGELEVSSSSLKFNRVVRDGAYVFTVQAEGMSKAKAIALERYHAMVPIQRSHFTWLLARCIPVRHWGRIEFVMPNYDYFTYEIVIDETVDIFELFEWMRRHVPISHVEEDEAWFALEDQESVLIEEMKAAGLNFRIEKSQWVQ